MSMSWQPIPEAEQANAYAECLKSLTALLPPVTAILSPDDPTVPSFEQIGIVGNIFTEKGYGFFAPLGRQRADVFFHVSEFRHARLDDLSRGQMVQFDHIEENRQGKKSAVGVGPVGHHVPLAVNLQRLTGRPPTEASLHQCLSLLEEIDSIISATNPAESVDARCSIANTIFRLLKNDRNAIAHKADLIRSMTLHNRARLHSVPIEDVVLVDQCRREFYETVREAFDGIRLSPIPRAVFQAVDQEILARLETHRRSLDDDVSLKNVLVQAFHFVYNADVRNTPEVVATRRVWRQEASRLCSETVAAVQRDLQNTDLGTAVAMILADHAGNTTPSVHPEVADQLSGHTQRIQARILEELRDHLEFRRPERSIRSRLRQLQSQCEMAWSQVQSALKAEGEVRIQQLQTGLATVERLLNQDSTNPILWEWVGYLHCLLEQYDSAEREFENTATFGRYSDPTALWNAALCRYRCGKTHEASRIMLGIVRGPEDGARGRVSHAPSTQDVELLAGLAIEANETSSILEYLADTEELELVVLGHSMASDIGDYELARRYLSQMTLIVQALNDEFQPLPLAEALDTGELERTVAYFLRYRLLNRGIRYFTERLDSKMGKALTNNALGRLYEAKGNPDKALMHLKFGCDLTVRSLKARPIVKSRQVKGVLDFCVRARRLEEGRDLLYQYRQFVGEDELDEYRIALGAPQEESEQPKGARGLSFAPVGSAQPPQDGRADPTERLAHLNYTLGSLGTIDELVEGKAGCLEYCDRVGELYGRQGQATAASMRKVVELLLDFAVEQDREQKRERLAEARAEYLRLDASLAKLPQSASQGLTLQKRLKAVLASAAIQSGRVKDPEIRLATVVLPDEFSSTSVVLSIANQADVDLADVKIRIDSMTGCVRCEEPESVVPILSAGQQIDVVFRVTRGADGWRDTLRASCDYRFGDDEHAVAVDTDLRLTFQKFEPFDTARYITDLAITTEHPENFQGREEAIETLSQRIRLQVDGRKGAVFVDGIRRVGKSSLVNFTLPTLPSDVVPVRIHMNRMPTDHIGTFLHSVIRRMARSLEASGIEQSLPRKDEYLSSPSDTFLSAMEELGDEYGGRRPLLYIDEFQKVMESIAMREDEGAAVGLDRRVLDLLQGLLDERVVLFVLSGSIRLQHLSQMARHAFFGRVQQVPVGFVDKAATEKILKAPLAGTQVRYTTAAVQRAWSLTHGYAWVVQRLGEGVLLRLSRDQRYVVSADDVDRVGEELIQSSDVFRWWWDEQYLGDAEEFAVARYLELVRKHDSVPRPQLKRALEKLGGETTSVLQNLCDQQVLSYDAAADTYELKGELLARWLPRMLEERRLRSDVSAYSGLIVDHENFAVTLEHRCEAVGAKDRFLDVLEFAISEVVAEAQRHGHLVLPISVAVWDRFLVQQTVYTRVNRDFDFPRARVSGDDAADDEMRRVAIADAFEHELLPKRTIGTIILVSGDHRFAGLVVKMQKRGQKVVVLGWKGSTSKELRDVAGPHFRYLDDIVSLKRVQG